MANRRMFSKAVISSAKFLKMPASSQALYFHLGMNADDDGVVEAFSIMRMMNSEEDNIRVLHAKGFVKILNEDLVTYITDWNEHNALRADRKVNSLHQKLLLEILPDVNLLEPKNRNDIKSTRKALTVKSGLTMDGQWTAEDSIGKDSIGNISAKKKSSSLEETLPETFTDCPSPAAPAQQHDGTIGAKAHKLITILGRDVTVQSVVSSLKKALEKDTRENILLCFNNYAKKVSFGRVYPQTLLKDETYKQYSLEKEKPPRLIKLEEILASPKRRTHPTEESAYGGKRQYQGLLADEEEEYNKLSIEFYGEIINPNTFRLYPE